MSKNNHSSFFVIKVMKKRITSIVLAISHPKLFANKNQGEWKLYSWLNVPAHAVNARVDPLPLSVTQRPVWTWVTVQPSAMSPLTPQEKHLMRKFWVLECKPISLNWIHGGKKKEGNVLPGKFYWLEAEVTVRKTLHLKCVGSIGSQPIFETSWNINLASMPTGKKTYRRTWRQSCRLAGQNLQRKIRLQRTACWWKWEWCDLQRHLWVAIGKGKRVLFWKWWEGPLGSWGCKNEPEEQGWPWRRWRGRSW